MRPRLAASAFRSEESGEKQNDLNARASKSFDPGPDLFSRGPTSRVSSALAGLTAVFGMLGLRSPAAALAGLRIINDAARRASPLQHLFRGLACAAIYVALIFWLALVLALDEMFRPQAAGFIPGWILDQVLLLLAFGG